ncbi:hypothetical protein KSF_037100 [Reticulibacter mediterranei]|uniref:Uncharacterized protein n=2 Tax=Reticulibacter mediterranei TaxID=2778369 RepID=A0A8J3N417_9CHLR|nr:hypothetical protein KSF_037100 [Reticulibacter mediterranei]
MYENGIHSEPVEQGKYGTGGVGEFVQIFDGLSLAGKTIRLTDMTDAYGNQGYHDAQLGWGKDSKYSLKVLCP